MTFYGNPNARIDSIDVSGGIVCRRTSGQTPCFIEVSASAITCVGTIVDTADNDIAGHSVTPYEDLEFSWDFGDPSGTRTLYDPYTDSTINANTDIVGGEAKYGYDAAGTYTCTLTVRGRNRSGGYIMAQTTQVFTVTAFNASGGTLYFDSINGSDANNGLTLGTAKQSMSAINTAIATPNRDIILVDGSSWIGDAGILIAGFGSPFRLRRSGGGAAPIIEHNGTSFGTSAFWMSNGGGASPRPHSDMVMQGIVFRYGGGASTGSVITIAGRNNATATTTGLYFDNCTMVFNGTADGTNQTTCQIIGGGYGFWGGSIRNISAFRGASGAYLSFDQWGWFYGTRFSGKGTDVTLDHHIYPNVRYHLDLAYVVFEDSSPLRNYCVNTNWDAAIEGDEAGYWNIKNCDMGHVRYAADASNGAGAGVRILNIAYERNLAHDLTNGAFAIFTNCESGSWRDNRFWNIGLGEIYEPSTDGIRPTPDLIGKFYRNYSYTDTPSTDFWVVNFIFGQPNGPQQITDNITYCTGIAARAIKLKASEQQGYNTLIDRNQYWLPNDSDQKAWTDNTTDKTFAQWQSFGFDVNGSVADPHFLDPANGDFTQFRRRVRLTATA